MKKHPFSLRIRETYLHIVSFLNLSSCSSWRYTQDFIVLLILHHLLVLVLVLSSSSSSSSQTPKKSCKEFFTKKASCLSRSSSAILLQNLSIRKLLSFLFPLSRPLSSKTSKLDRSKATCCRPNRNLNCSREMGFAIQKLKFRMKIHWKVIYSSELESSDLIT